MAKATKVKKVKTIKTVYYKKNKSKMLSYQNQYNEENRGMVYSKNRNRELNRKYGTPIQTCPKQLKALAKLYNKAIALSRKTGIKHVVDHTYPASKGGLHCTENCKVITASENAKKYWQVDRHLPDIRTWRK